jgi:hypothetical protein
MLSITIREVPEGRVDLREDKEKGVINAWLTSNETTVIDAQNIRVSAIGYPDYVNNENGIPIKELSEGDRAKVFGSIEKRDFEISKNDRKIFQLYIQATRNLLIFKRCLPLGELEISVRYFSDSEKKRFSAMWKLHKQTDFMDFHEKQFYVLSSGQKIPFPSLTAAEKASLQADIIVKRITVTDSEIQIEG